MKKLLLLIGVSLVILVGFLLLKSSDGSKILGDKIQVTASFYPLAEFARQVGGDKIDVLNLTPAGSEPHDFDPSPKDLVTLQNSKIFVYNGAGFEPWVERVLPDLQKSGVVVVNDIDGIDLLPTSEEEEYEHEGEEEHLFYDPHVWLDPILVTIQVDNIYKAFAQTDPANKDYYQKNTTNYKIQLQKLDEEFKTGLSNCQTRNVVVSHNAFAYLAKRYSLNILPISGLSPDEEPSPQKMAEIVNFAKKNNVKYIFFETLVSPRLSETIAEEIGAATLVLNPIEGLSEREIAQGLDYIAVSRQNLSNLRVALNCK